MTNGNVPIADGNTVRIFDTTLRDGEQAPGIALTRAEMRRILDEIQSGQFAKEWIAEADGGFGNFLRLRSQARTSQLEDVGRGLRQMMPWLESETKVVPE